MGTAGGALTRGAGSGAVGYASVGSDPTVVPYGLLRSCPPLTFAVGPGQVGIIGFLTMSGWIEGTGWITIVSGADPVYHFGLDIPAFGWITGNGVYRMEFQALAMWVIVCSLGSVEFEG
jgi:hypothetical protein